MADTKMQLIDWLDDLCVRFIVNLPEEELGSVARICFQVEEAQWFYEDFIRPTDPSLPSLNLRDFCLRIFQHCPLLSAFSDSQHTAAYQEFLAYKTRVPVRGAILLNHDMDQVLLVKGWKKGATWSFPRGKINKDEPDLDCAIREVWEETGYDIAAAGLANDDQKYIDVTMREQHLRMFVFRDVPLDTYFEPKTRKEISKIKWYRLADLPSYIQRKPNRNHPEGAGDQGPVSANKLYMVAPFLPPLKKWINQQRKRDLARQGQVGSLAEEAQNLVSDSPAPEVESTAQLPANAAFELKRLLSVNGGSQDASPTTIDEGNQANALLAMLRGGPSAGNLVPSFSNDLPPVTPMDQVTGTPPEPSSPHYHHAKPSPAVKQQPPPSFPFPSPAHQYQHQHNGSSHGPSLLGSNAHENLQRALPQKSQQHFQPPQQIHSQGPPVSMQQQFFPGSHPAPIHHEPIAPAASQLPAPRLNNHAMNLLSAFRAPSHPQGTSPAGFHATPHNNAQMSYPSLDQIPVPNHLPGQQHQQPPIGNAQHTRQRSAHQNSLLGLFRSPEPATASPAISESTPRNYAPSPVQQPNPDLQPAIASPPKQRSLSLAMMTRTLPKAKAVPPPLQSSNSAGMFPAKQAVREAQLANHPRSVSEAANKSFAPDAPRAPVSILPRPGSAATKDSPAPPTPEKVPSPHKLTRGHKNDAPANFTILQRPSPKATSTGSPEMPTPRQAAPKQKPTKQPQEAPKQFQPQILQRPKSEVTGSSSGQENAPQDTNNQRNALLALFAKQNPGLAQMDNNRSGSAMSGSSGAPLPSDPTMFRSRLASASSAVSNGDNDGLKSPSTPVEAKGFLLDYLNGVVKNEKNKSSKRGHV